ncbi:hypothetical protein LCGC14_1628270 [marine sediment metagenome]|uniref:Uncharacterized protein n=1 Tax=marine sediment metagenome TaxID=412755 RepID=A0A0F9IQG6_9ZZZZ
MGNGTKRFVQIEKYICSLRESKQLYAIYYYRWCLNHHTRHFINKPYIDLKWKSKQAVENQIDEV